MEFGRVRSDEVESLVAFLTGDEWPFHTDVVVAEEVVRRRAADGGYADTFWIAERGVRVGLVRLMDLGNGTPLFDLRVAAAHRGRGIGTAAVAWLTRYVFTHYATDRIEGTTRQDNLAMRRTFEKAGYVKEAHYREAWPSPEGPRDSVGYAILRRDWENGTVTAVDFSA
jgi:RimJ/RimL family protein N-acetyltransferase